MARRRRRRQTDPEAERLRLQDGDATAAARATAARLVAVGTAIRSRGLAAAAGRGDPGRATDAVWRDFENELSLGMTASRISGIMRARQSVGIDLPHAPPRVATIPDQVRKVGKAQAARLVETIRPSVARIRAELERVVDTRIRAALAETLAQNMPVAAARAHLSQAYKLAGIVPENSYTFENIARTYTAIAYSAGRLDVENSPDMRGLIWGYRYATVGDDRVRAEHAALDGVTLPIDDPFWDTWYPPNDWSCRCSAIALFAPAAIKRPPENTPPGPASFRGRGAGNLPPAYDVGVPSDVAHALQKAKADRR